MRRSSVVAGTLIAIFAVACAASSSTSSTSPSSVPSTASQAGTATARAFSANIVTTGMGSGNARISGTITLTPIDANTFSLTMELRGAQANRQLPWAIRPGSCGDATPNSDIGNRSAYSPIQTQADGQASVNSRIRIQLPAQTLHVDIMQSQTQRDVVVGCGVLLAR